MDSSGIAKAPSDSMRVPNVEHRRRDSCFMRPNGRSAVGSKQLCRTLLIRDPTCPPSCVSRNGETVRVVTTTRLTFSRMAWEFLFMRMSFHG